VRHIVADAAHFELFRALHEIAVAVGGVLDHDRPGPQLGRPAPRTALPASLGRAAGDVAAAA